MEILLITPYYPYPSEKTGGVHTINKLINGMSKHIIDIFYYGEDRTDECTFSECIRNVFYEDLRKKGKTLRIRSLMIGKTYTSYMYKSYSRVLDSVLEKNHYELIIYDQYSSMQMVKNNNTEKLLFMHDSMPLLFARKMNLNLKNHIYYYLQKKYAIREEHTYYKLFDRIVFVSSKDIDEEKKIHNINDKKFMLCDLGIDIELVEQSEKQELPIHSLVFTGVMDYEPNLDAMVFFVNKVFQKIKQRVPDVKLYIVGKNPTKEIVEYGQNKDIVVTGIVENVFSYIKGASIYVSPLRIGSGKKNKIIEALACETPIIASEISMDGFDESIRKCVLISKNEQEWIDNTVELLLNEDKRMRIKAQMKNVIDESYRWDIIANGLLVPFQK